MHHFYLSKFCNLRTNPFNLIGSNSFFRLSFFLSVIYFHQEAILRGSGLHYIEVCLNICWKNLIGVYWGYEEGLSQSKIPSLKMTVCWISWLFLARMSKKKDENQKTRNQPKFLFSFLLSMTVSLYFAYFLIVWLRYLFLFFPHIYSLFPSFHLLIYFFLFLSSFYLFYYFQFCSIKHSYWLGNINIINIFQALYKYAAYLMMY